MDIHTEVINDDDGEGYLRRLFVLFEAGRFAQPILVLDEHQVEGIVAKYMKLSREEVQKRRRERRDN